MRNIEDYSDEELREPGPAGMVDKRTAEKLGIPLEKVVEILEVWEDTAFEVNKERVRRRPRPVASDSRTVVK